LRVGLEVNGPEDESRRRMKVATSGRNPIKASEANR
jgi:hypothetical protein